MVGILFVYLLCGVSSIVAINQANDIREPPSIYAFGLTSFENETIKQHIYMRNDKISFTCKAKGHPTPRYLWQKDMRNLTSYCSMLVNKGSLDIHYADRCPSGPEEGWYQCLAINEYGTAASDKIQLKKSYLNIIRHNEVDEKTIVKITGGTLEIPCEQRYSSYPLPKFIWIIDQRTYPYGTDPFMINNRSVIDQETGTLYISNITPEDEQRYQCLVDLKPRIPTPREVPVVHEVKVINGSLSFSPPMLWIPKQEDNFKVAVVGQNLTLLCLFNGNPVPEIKWSLPKDVSHSRVQRNPYNTTLTLVNLSNNDAGLYECIAKNSKGTVTNHYVVKIEYAPSFNRPLTDVAVTEGESITFDCTTKAQPPVLKQNISWMINAEPLASAYNHKHYHLSNDHSTLIIRNVCKIHCSPDKPPGGDLMVVQCNASNVHGYAYASAYLNVIVPTIVEVSPKKKKVPTATLR